MPALQGIVGRSFVLAAGIALSACSGGEGTLLNPGDGFGSGVDAEVVRNVQILAEPVGGADVIVRARPLGTLNQPLELVPVLFSIDEGDSAIATLRAEQPVSTIGQGAFAVLTFAQDDARSVPVNVQVLDADGAVILERSITVASPIVQAAGEPSSTALRLISSSTALDTDADLPSEGVQLTVLATDAANNLVAGATINFSTCELDANGSCFDSGIVGGAGALQVTQAVTDAMGTARAILTTGGDVRNRRVRVTATPTANPGIQTTFDIQVAGTVLELAGPARLSSTSTGDYVATLRDAGGFPVAGETVRFVQAGPAAGGPVTSASQLCSQGTTLATIATNAAGEAAFRLVRPATDLRFLACVFDNAEAQLIAVDVAETGLVAQIEGTSAANPEIEFRRCERVVLNLSSSDGSSVAEQPIRVAISRGVLLEDDFDVDDAEACATAPVPQPALSVVDTGVDGRVTLITRAEAADGAGLALFRAEHEPSGATATVEPEFLAILPDRLDAVAEPASITPGGSAVIRAVVRDADNNFVKNQIVRFSLQDASGGSLNSPVQTTNSQGRAQVTYTASSSASTRDSVQVTATIEGTDIADTAALTVGGNALRISLGTGNQIAEPTTTLYAKPFAVIVTDAVGNPAPPETQFRLSIRVLDYQKGFYIFNGSVWVPQYMVPPMGQREDPPIGPFPTFADGCDNEDRFDEGIGGVLDPLDPPVFDPNPNAPNRERRNEDLNLDGVLTPGNVVSLPAVTELDENGIGEFDLTYAQENANWIRVELRAVASVSGSESVELQTFVLDGAASDFNDEDVNPPGNPSPYGQSNSCFNPD